VRQPNAKKEIFKISSRSITTAGIIHPKGLALGRQGTSCPGPPASSTAVMWFSVKDLTERGAVPWSS
jgi:hypothetical protein